MRAFPHSFSLLMNFSLNRRIFKISFELQHIKVAGNGVSFLHSCTHGQWQRKTIKKHSWCDHIYDCKKRFLIFLVCSNEIKIKVGKAHTTQKQSWRYSNVLNPTLGMLVQVFCQCTLDMYQSACSECHRHWSIVGVHQEQGLYCDVTTSGEKLPL